MLSGAGANCPSLFHKSPTIRPQPNVGCLIPNSQCDSFEDWVTEQISNLRDKIFFFLAKELDRLKMCHIGIRLACSTQDAETLTDREGAATPKTSPCPEEAEIGACPLIEFIGGGANSSLGLSS